MHSLSNQCVRWDQLSAAARRDVLRRPASAVQENTDKAVREIIAAVRARGDDALLDYARRFDRFAGGPLAVTPAEWEAGLAETPKPVLAALEQAAGNIRRFHAEQYPRSLSLEVAPGVHCRRVWRPLGRVGLYVPAGTAPLPSTVLMLAIPAALAGCQERVICTPVGASGRVHPGILAAARLAGVTSIYKVGGAHGVAAMAYGTETVPRVDKVFGPGNAYVTHAKMLSAQDPDGAACDMPAGPSEVMVVIDANANPAFAAADLLSQAEHGADSHVVLVSLDDEALARTLAETERQLADLPRRDVAAAALTHAWFVRADGMAEALAIANAYAPEHLILQVEDAGRYVDAIANAGSVFLGRWTPEAVGDYASGTNHVLPTYGLARSHGGLTVESFMKSMTVQELTAAGLRSLGPVVETLAGVEGLAAHARAVRIRLEADYEV